MASPIVIETPLWWDIEFEGVRDQFNKFKRTREQALAEFFALKIKKE